MSKKNVLLTSKTGFLIQGRGHIGQEVIYPITVKCFGNCIQNGYDDKYIERRKL